MPTSPQDLRAILSTTAKRNSLLGAVPPALRGIPLAAMVCADLLKEWGGWDVVLASLRDTGDAGIIEIGAPGDDEDGRVKEGTERTDERGTGSWDEGGGDEVVNEDTLARREVCEEGSGGGEGEGDG